MYRYNPYNPRRRNPYRQNLFGGLKAKAAGIKDSLGRKVSSRIREGEDIAKDYEAVRSEIEEAVSGLTAELSSATSDLIHNTDPDNAGPYQLKNTFEAYGEVVFARGQLQALLDLANEGWGAEGDIDKELLARAEESSIKAAEILEKAQEMLEMGISAWVPIQQEFDRKRLNDLKCKYYRYWTDHGFLRGSSDYQVERQRGSGSSKGLYDEYDKGCGMANERDDEPWLEQEFIDWYDCKKQKDPSFSNEKYCNVPPLPKHFQEKGKRLRRRLRRRR